MATTQAENNYPLQNEDEMKRLSSQHEVIKDSLGGLVLAPIDLSSSPLCILDSGTADGTWIRDLAASCKPAHEFYGTDINPAEFPTDPPSGTTYQAQDINQPWPAEWKGKFDLVHQRLVIVAGGPKQKEAVQALAALVKPGGWIQFIDATNEFPESNGPAMGNFIKVMHSIFKVMGADLKATAKIAGWLGEAGFVDIEDRIVPEKLGAMNPKANLAQQGVSSMTTAATGLAQFAKTLPAEALDLPAEKLDTVASDLTDELTKVGAVFPLQVIWGRKPVS